MKKLFVHMKALLNTLICLIGNFLLEKRRGSGGFTGGIALVGRPNAWIKQKSYTNAPGRAIAINPTEKAFCHILQKKSSGYRIAYNEKRHLYKKRKTVSERAPCRGQDRSLFSVHIQQLFVID